MGGIHEYAVEVDSGAMIFIPSFIKISSLIQKLIVGGHTDTHRQHADLIGLLLLFLNKKRRLKTGRFLLAPLVGVSSDNIRFSSQQLQCWFLKLAVTSLGAEF
jgi:hypothetical protein